MTLREFTQRIILTLLIKESHTHSTKFPFGDAMSANQIHPLPVRMPLDLKEWVKHLALAKGTSLNTEIVQILEQAKAQHDQAGERK